MTFARRPRHRDAGATRGASAAIACAAIAIVVALSACGSPPPDDGSKKGEAPKWDPWISAGTTFRF